MDSEKLKKTLKSGKMFKTSAFPLANCDLGENLIYISFSSQTCKNNDVHTKYLNQNLAMSMPPPSSSSSSLFALEKWDKRKLAWVCPKKLWENIVGNSSSIHSACNLPSFPLETEVWSLLVTYYEWGESRTLSLTKHKEMQKQADLGDEKMKLIHKTKQKQRKKQQFVFHCFQGAGSTSIWVLISFSTLYDSFFTLTSNSSKSVIQAPERFPPNKLK